MYTCTHVQSQPGLKGFLPHISWYCKVSREQVNLFESLDIAKANVFLSISVFRCNFWADWLPELQNVKYFTLRNYWNQLLHPLQIPKFTFFPTFLPGSMRSVTFPKSGACPLLAKHKSVSLHLLCRPCISLDGPTSSYCNSSCGRSVSRCANLWGIPSYLHSFVT